MAKRKTSGKHKLLRLLLLFTWFLILTWIEIHEGVDPTSNQGGSTSVSVVLSADDVPQYTGADTIEINWGKSTFFSSELHFEGEGWISYGDLDELNRVTTMNAMITPEMYQTGTDANSSILPTGWSKSNQNESNPKQLNRGHLLADVLGGSGEDWRNLVTLYRNANYPAMYFAAEFIVSEAIQAGTTVRYRVTPIFKGDELICEGLHIMAKSVGDDSVDLNVYVFNEPKDAVN
ncbi:DNA/RNA non-specific endonuclease [uncultured Trichococcus sp.]|uniref:DNA/RNA non-specific endonuclease n=1 Tax=uncultured Trichococcus sp. TaxID=189665 RepID=UPI0029C65CDC|nr:DNA/RNA non-specific endonuclease [uncultured Trichococcus sp.]